jgi:inosine-uridine nucleoside N-ribohydrolase
VKALKIHLDTDLGGDIDDLCALAMLLRWSEDTELVGITTVAEAGGRRAGYVKYVLGLEGKGKIPVAAGADVSQGFYRYSELGYPSEERYWPEPVPSSPNSTQDAILLLKNSIEQGATIVAIGPFTNLYLLDLKYPGLLKEADLFLMGGFIFPIRSGFPQWGNAMDWNIQVDVGSARHVLENSSPTLIPLTVTVETALRRTYLVDLQKSGELGKLIARQAEAFAADEEMERKFGETCEKLPKDIINFLHDPLACAIALGLNEGVEISEIPLKLEIRDGWLYEEIDAKGKATRVVTKIDGDRFNEVWIKAVSNSAESA